jgi:predicted amidophosphoribosyltransferase
MQHLLHIDEEMLHDQQHWSLEPSDECYYLLEYTAGDRRTGAHNLIHDLKKPLDTPWKDLQKESAIREAARILRPALYEFIDFGAVTIVPVPPSKIRSSPLYDDRVLRMLRRACPQDADIRELIITRADMPASHETTRRPSSFRIEKNYVLNRSAAPVLPDTVVIFDDVITAGSHFAACKRFLAKTCGPRRYIGVFLARRAFKRMASL